jgi:HEAT repeat protein
MEKGAMSARTEIPEQDESGVDVRRAETARQALFALGRAVKAVRLYPSGNTVVAGARRELFRRLESYLGEYGDLELTVTRAALHLDGVPVHEDEGAELDLAFQLTLESVREVTIYASVAEEEIDRFLGILSRLGRRREDEVDDLETLLWEEDLEGIDVLILDRFYDDLGDEEEFLEFVEEGEPDPDALAVAATEREELTEVLGEAAGPVLPPDPVNLGILDDDDRLRLEGVLAEEKRRDVMTTFGSILVDVLGVEDDRGAFERLAEVLGRQLRILLEQKELLRAARILGEAERALGGWDDPDRRSAVESALASLSTSAVLEELPDAVAEADEDGLADLRLLLSRIAGAEPDAVVRLLEQSDVRDLAIAALQDHLERLVPYLASRVRDPRPAVVVTVVKLLAGTGGRRAAEIVAEAAAHPETRVRVEAVRAAATMAEGHRVLQRALGDESEEVRLMALRSPVQALGPAIVRLLKERIASRDISASSFLEKRELFHALARAGGHDVVPFLARVLDRKPLFRKDRTDELRACAASALGAVGSKEALDALDRHLEDRSDRVREATFGALREATRRRKRRRT